MQNMYSVRMMLCVYAALAFLTPDEEALRQRGAHIALGEAANQLGNRQAVVGAQRVQQRHSMELRCVRLYKMVSSVQNFRPCRPS